LWWPSGDALKANINELQTDSEIVEDVILSQDNASIWIQAYQQMDNVEQISFSFAYDSDNLTFSDAVSDIDGVEITKIETNPGFSSFILVFQNPISISENTEIVTVDYTRWSEKTVYLNPINFNFTDSSRTNYSLTASSLIF